MDDRLREFMEWLNKEGYYLAVDDGLQLVPAAADNEDLIHEFVYQVMR